MSNDKWFNYRGRNNNNKLKNKTLKVANGIDKKEFEIF